MIDTYKAFGSDPVPIAWSEALTATQTGTVDGGDLPIDVMYSQILTVMRFDGRVLRLERVARQALEAAIWSS